jgi:hypothetical protein
LISAIDSSAAGIAVAVPLRSGLGLPTRVRVEGRPRQKAGGAFLSLSFCRWLRCDIADSRWANCPYTCGNWPVWAILAIPRGCFAEPRGYPQKPLLCRQQSRPVGEGPATFGTGPSPLTVPSPAFVHGVIAGCSGTKNGQSRKRCRSLPRPPRDTFRQSRLRPKVEPLFMINLNLVPLAGLEPATIGLEVRCSIR